ncbi:MAG: nickel pincer cofactor biosynthesis protein LarC [Lachnospiraceae bacterium]
MKTLFIECNMGAAGDMLMGALYELLDDSEKNDFLDTMNHLFSEDITLSSHPCEKCGIFGTKMDVSIFGEAETNGGALLHSEHFEAADAHTKHVHSHTTYPQMLALIDSLAISPTVKEHAKAVYTLIGNAESHAHHIAISQIHFHEVGTLDALVDVIGCCILFDILAPEQIIASPIHVGSGMVQCAHGILPVPAPATAEILKDIPIYCGTIAGELCTPTGAALLKHFVGQFVTMPPMTIEKVGYGMGTSDFPSANCVRIFYGTMNILPVLSKRQLPHLQSTQVPSPVSDMETSPEFYGEVFHSLDQILELSCNLDDMTPEAVSFAIDILLEAGALDVFTTSINMKKNRSAFMLTCLCNPEEEGVFSKLMLTHTTTRGIRIQPCYRRTLDAEYQKVSTPYGEITIKISTGYGIHKIKPEYDDVANAARKHKVTFLQVSHAAVEAYNHHK